MAKIVNRHYSGKRRIIEVDGYKFPSRSEANRYRQLKILLSAGEIKDLVVHPRLPLIVNGKKIGRGSISLDFHYKERQGGEWPEIWEDHKPVQTRESKVRIQVAEAIHGINIRLSK